MLAAMAKPIRGNMRRTPFDFAAIMDALAESVKCVMPQALLRDSELTNRGVSPDHPLKNTVLPWRCAIITPLRSDSRRFRIASAV